MFTGRLYDFQKDAVNLFKDKKRVLFGHPVGKGKTIMAIASIEKVNLKRVLVLVEKSSIKQWENTIRSYTDSNWIIVQDDKDFRGKEKYVLMVYEQLYTRNFYIKQFDAVILDEITKVKNWNKLYKKVAYITKFKEYVLGLTATPVENKLEEFYRIFQVINPNVFKGYNLNKFREDFVKGYWDEIWNRYLGKKVKIYKSIGYKNIAKFKDMISNYYITTENNENKIERLNVVKWLEFNEILYRYYRYIYDSYEGQMGLDMVTDLELILSGVFVKRKNKVVESIEYFPNSPKLEMLRKIINDYKSGIVIFSKYKEPLNYLIKEFAGDMDIITGDINMDKRYDLIARFNKGDLKILGLTTAGEKGINLKGGRILIFLNQLYNPARNEQIAGRIMRMDNKYNKIAIVKLLVRGSIDGWVESLLNRKLDLVREFTNIKDWDKVVFYKE